MGFIVNIVALLGLIAFFVVKIFVYLISGNVNLTSTFAISGFISIILFIGLKEKKSVYDLFINGARDGIKVVFKLFPTLIGIFLAIYMLRSSGLIDFICNILANITKLINIPSEILPLAIIKPISGSGSMAIATEIMAHFGVDSNIGRIAATIMGSSETTFYVIALYMSSVKAKDGRKIVIPALLADIASIISAIIIFKILKY